MKNKKILIAEDDKLSAELISTILKRAGYSFEITKNGKDAFNKLVNGKFDALLTDWMMPEMDGIELIRKVRSVFDPPPAIMVLTALNSEEARNHALKSGADDFLSKPYDPVEVITRLGDLFARIEQPIPTEIILPKIRPAKKLPFVGVCIAASSGGPQALRKVIKSLPLLDNAVFFIVQHGPSWALSYMAGNWKGITDIEVVLGKDGLKVKPGTIYLAPGNTHMTVRSGSVEIALNDGPAENYVKPAADPLFRSVAKCFGDRSIGVIMSGMGCDGAVGAKHIASANGIVIIQSPETATAKFMPQAAIKTVPDTLIIDLDDIADTIVRAIKNIMNIK